jgi:hypothetical protein
VCRSSTAEVRARWAALDRPGESRRRPPAIKPSRVFRKDDDDRTSPSIRDAGCSVAAHAMSLFTLTWKSCHLEFT